MDSHPFLQRGKDLGNPLALIQSHGRSSLSVEIGDRVLDCRKLLLLLIEARVRVAVAVNERGFSHLAMSEHSYDGAKTDSLAQSLCEIAFSEMGHDITIMTSDVDFEKVFLKSTSDARS
jgi:hypothetical protein